MRLLGRLNVRVKLVLLLALPALLLVGAAAVGASFVHDRMISDREIETQRLVEVAVGIVKSWQAKEIAGTLTREQAQAGAIEMLRPLRYGAKDYFFVQSYQGVAILNDPQRTLEGHMRIDAKDPDGVPNVKLQIEAAKSGGGFVYYRFPRAGSKDPVQKLSYASGFEPWQWAICTGVYVDDIETEYRALSLRLGLAALGIILVTALITFLVCRNIAGRAARAKAEFLATMSHEIRTPMAAVTGIIEQLRETSLNVDQGRMVEMAYESASSLRGVLDDVLDFSKIEAGAITIAREPIELSRFVNTVSETLAHAASQKGLVLETDIQTDAPDRVSIDPVRLRQILVNLVSNAIKFTAYGTVRLSVSTVAGSGAATLDFSVTDTGIGMSPEVISRLFVPFVQADASTMRDFGGTGLGLSISRHLAELMGGRLQAKSHKGIGSVFTLQLPVEVCTTENLPIVVTAGYPQFDDVHALVAEDMPTNRWLIQRQLERMGFRVTAVENGIAAIDALAKGSYDLLITDFHMPKMDGIGLARHIRDAEARAGTGMHLPILGLTADVTGNSRDLCLAAGMDGVAAKPTDMKGLGAALQRLLQSQCEDSDAEAGAAGPRAVFDDTAYREIFAPSDPEGKNWLTEFVATTQITLAEQRAAAEALDRAEFAATAHRLASASLVAGAMQLGHCGRNLEGLATDASIEELLDAIVTAEDAYKAARIEIMRRITQTGEIVI